MLLWSYRVERSVRFGGVGRGLVEHVTLLCLRKRGNDVGMYNETKFNGAILCPPDATNSSPLS